ncbi:MAG TPA: hypothetical protein VE986_02805 [Hyphomicrobiales bacterium]|nr:hypothetical protein [Hyphomicrobiales bacterium]
MIENQINEVNLFDEAYEKLGSVFQARDSKNPADISRLAAYLVHRTGDYNEDTIGGALQELRTFLALISVKGRQVVSNELDAAFHGLLLHTEIAAEICKALGIKRLAHFPTIDDAERAAVQNEYETTIANLQRLAGPRFNAAYWPKDGMVCKCDIGRVI